MCNQQPNNANIFHRLQVGKIGARKSTATLGSAFAKLGSSSELPFPRPLKGTIIIVSDYLFSAGVFTTVIGKQLTIKNKNCFQVY